MRVLVTDGDSRAALAVTRSLGRRGHEILVGEKHGRSLSHGSRYCVERVVYPDPSRNSEAFLEGIGNVVRSQAIDVLLPISDVTTFLIAANRQRFACRIPLPDISVLERAANKVDILETAARIGVPVPRGIVLSDAAALRDQHVDYPVVVKPWRSRVNTRQGWHAPMVSHAANRDDLVRDLSARPDHSFPVLLQERIVGPGLGVFACIDEGRPVALFSHRRLRERPPWGGVSVLCESVELEASTRDQATRLLAEIGWQGPAMVEFKLDHRDGLPKLMEINGRFWGSLQLAVDAGVDFPVLALQAIHHGPFEVQRPYRIGIRSRWLWGDVDSLLLTLRGSTGLRTPLSGSGRLAALWEFGKFLGKDLYYDNPKWDDWWPMVVETRARLTATAAALFGRLRHEMDRT